jgi:hypothetical protein
MWTDEQFKDITFNCIGGSIKAHKIILKASGNKYFETLLAGNLPIQDVYDMTDVKLEYMTALLEDIYGINKGRHERVLDAENSLFQTAFEIFTFGQRFMFKAYEVKAGQMFGKIKVESLSDQEFDLFLLISSENGIFLDYDKLSTPFILSKVYGVNNMMSNESFVRFVSRIIWKDKDYEYMIIMDDRVTCQIFARFFASPFTLYSSQELMNFVKKGLLHFESACKILTLKSIGLKNHQLYMVVKESNPVNYEFTIIAARYDDAKQRCNIYPKLRDFDHKALVLENDMGVANENIRKVSSLSVGEFFKKYQDNITLKEVLIVIF